MPPLSAAEVADWRARLPRAFARTPAGRAAAGAGWSFFLLWLGLLLWWFDFSPARIANGLFGQQGVLTILRLMIPPSPGEQADQIFQGLGESVAMAFLGTVMAALVAIPLGVLGAANVVANRVLHFLVRRVFDTFRGVDVLIWALAYVRAVGLGPLAGVLAIFTADLFVLAKLFAEAIENADPKVAEGVRATGAGRLLVVRFGLVPEVMPVMLAQALYFFESNTRSAAILGVVGAGGIGLQIAERIRVRLWDEVLFIILMILLVVAAIDFASARIRVRLIGPR
ncbi:MAG: phosphonate ABC transporter, permease protein PhnE [Acetobacteraceae bacterium]|nr:phosphonate ABC transporter, permease protein PhnE [Acetobacteraceae bacterium]